MRRIATCLIVGGLVLSVTGCKNKDGAKWSGKTADATTVTDPYAPADSSIYQPTTTYPQYDQTYTEPASVERTYQATAEPAMDDFATRYHTVAKKDTLYGLARSYYGDQRRWKDIYEANRGDITDPNRIRVGQRLLIP